MKSTPIEADRRWQVDKLALRRINGSRINGWRVGIRFVDERNE
ncbi:MAG: hypothetical protein AAGG48_27170 [Planctomycetota bacterium]